MNLNLPELFEKQRALREKIISNHNLEGVDLLRNFIFSFRVELSELANTWRGFKHWSVDREIRKDEALEEYADSLSFLLEIGLELGFEDTYFSLIEIEKLYTRNNVFEGFEVLYSVIEKFKEKKNRHWYEVLFGHFIGLGGLLGFTQNEAEQAYMEKNKINHERQESGY